MVDCLLLQIFTVCAILMFIEKSYYIFPFFRDILFETSNLRQHLLITVLDLRNLAISDSVYPHTHTTAKCNNLVKKKLSDSLAKLFHNNWNNDLQF